MGLVLLMPPSPLLLEDMLVLADMSPTLLESSMLPRERPKPRLKLTQLSSTPLPTHTAMDTPMLDMETLPTPTPMDTHMPMLDTPMPMLMLLQLPLPPPRSPHLLP